MGTDGPPGLAHPGHQWNQSLQIADWQRALTSVHPLAPMDPLSPHLTPQIEKGRRGPSRSMEERLAVG